MQINSKGLLFTMLSLAVVLSLVFVYTSTTSKAKAQPLPRPNIIVILSDDQKFNSMKFMTYLSSKPYGHWVEFSNAFLNNALCCPSRATLLSGLYSHHHGIGGNNGTNFKDASTIATWLKSGGYKTAFIGKYLNEYPFSNKPTNYIPPGWDHWMAFSGQPQYYSYTLNENGVLKAYGSTVDQYSTDVLTQKATDYINAASTTEPFFMIYSPKAPHASYTIASRHKAIASGFVIEPSPNFNEADVSDKPAWVRKRSLLSASAQADILKKEKNAAGTLLAVDEGIKSMFDALVAKGMLENTAVIYYTDNGFSFGSHRWSEKRCEYEECIHTPLLVYYPWTDSRTEARVVSNVDIAVTIADLAQVSRDPVDGLSLVPLLNNTATTWREAMMFKSSGGSPATWWGVRAKDWKYVELTSGEKELYDMINDPYELNNVANKPEYTVIQQSLATQLSQLKNSPPQ